MQLHETLKNQVFKNEGGRIYDDRYCTHEHRNILMFIYVCMYLFIYF